ncbi:hypothetical protein BDP81DRAFT_100930 [Colletotrichum phormii]|uniref:Uncharacterized protein n=1 Tax=Colletotrichum phormii TaxID=359342 RepID=A0AAJ0EBN0_9PEZI|nr:uncharacterized protein BDP81DRAFT_100930 [Colletotrichum phormii]KAK1625260.1 hypothetical protein BDP81DRAFT_100930 [Colletotrichum phormii]
MAQADCLGVFLEQTRLGIAWYRFSQRYVVCLAQSIGGASAKAARPTQGEEKKRAMEQLEIPTNAGRRRTRSRAVIVAAESATLAAWHLVEGPGAALFFTFHFFDFICSLGGADFLASSEPAESEISVPHCRYFPRSNIIIIQRFSSEVVLRLNCRWYEAWKRHEDPVCKLTSGVLIGTGYEWNFSS